MYTWGIKKVTRGGELALFPIPSCMVSPLDLSFPLPFHKKDSPLIQAKT